MRHWLILTIFAVILCSCNKSNSLQNIDNKSKPIQALELRGISLGMSLNDVQKKYPNFYIGSMRDAYGGDYRCIDTANNPELVDLSGLCISLLDEKVYGITATYNKKYDLSIDELAEKTAETLGLDKNCRWKTSTDKDYTALTVKENYRYMHCNGFRIEVSKNLEGIKIGNDDMPTITIEGESGKFELVRRKEKAIQEEGNKRKEVFKP